MAEPPVDGYPAYYACDGCLEAAWAAWEYLVAIAAFLVPKPWLAEQLEPNVRLFLALAWRCALCYYIILQVLLVYKSQIYTYPPWAVFREVVLLLLLLLMNVARLPIAQRGILLRNPILLALDIWLAMPASYLVGYHLNFQVYVLRLEVVICSIALGLLTKEVVLLLIMGIAFSEGGVHAVLLCSGLSAFVGMLAFVAAYDSEVGST